MSREAVSTDGEKIAALKQVSRAAIRALYKAGFSEGLIAVTTGLQRGTVSRIVRGVVPCPGAEGGCCRTTMSAARTQSYAGPVRTMSAEEEAEWVKQVVESQ